MVHGAPLPHPLALCLEPGETRPPPPASVQAAPRPRPPCASPSPEEPPLCQAPGDTGTARAGRGLVGSQNDCCWPEGVSSTRSPAGPAPEPPKSPPETAFRTKILKQELPDTETCDGKGPEARVAHWPRGLWVLDGSPSSPWAAVRGSEAPGVTVTASETTRKVLVREPKRPGARKVQFRPFIGGGTPQSGGWAQTASLRERGEGPLRCVADPGEGGSPCGCAPPVLGI